MALLALAVLVGAAGWDRAWGAEAKRAALEVNLRTRGAAAEETGRLRLFCEHARWEPARTALIVCDMWDRHWCKAATRRVAALAPAVERVVSAARARGVLIIHAPSETMDHYAGHPARRRAADAPAAANVPEGIERWCAWKDEREKNAGYPIDQSDGGCDCEPPCREGTPWTKQIDTIRIDDSDAISDSGAEIWNLLAQRDIDNVILVGVHANMCVLGRPFGLRNLARRGKNVVLMRDLTDALYNPARPPYVSHFTGTDLIVAHVETYVCPTIVSTVLTGAPPFRFAEDARPLVVFLSAESEYRAAETLPEFARELELRYGLSCDLVQGSTEASGSARHEISGLEVLDDADLVVVFARRRAFPAEQMEHLRDYLDRGGPLIGLRTASHAFDARGAGPADHVEWAAFDRDVLGGNYHGHYGGGITATITPAPGGQTHRILAGVPLPFPSQGSLYQTQPLAPATTCLLTGMIASQEPEPVAWTNTYCNSRIFYTSLGHPDDFQTPSFRRLLVNAVFWALDRPVPERR